jgi:hypothetical protein
VASQKPKTSNAVWQKMQINLIVSKDATSQGTEACQANNNFLHGPVQVTHLGLSGNKLKSTLLL